MSREVLSPQASQRRPRTFSHNSREQFQQLLVLLVVHLLGLVSVHGGVVSRTPDFNHLAACCKTFFLWEVARTILLNHVGMVSALYFALHYDCLVEQVPRLALQSMREE